jgi:hypothetical protein
MGNVRRGLERFKTDIGIDILNDVQSITVEIKPPAGRGGSPEMILGHIVGKFDAATLLSKFEKDMPVKRMTVGSRVLLVGSDNIGVEVINNHIFFGQVERLKSLKKDSFSGKMSSVVASLKSGGQDLWVGIMGDMMKVIGRTDPRLNVFKQVIASIDFAPGFHLNVDAVSKDPAIASMIAQQVQAQIKQVSGAPQMQMFASLINKISIKAEGPRLILDIPLDQQNVTQLNMIASMVMMGRQNRKKPAKSSAPPLPVTTPAHDGSVRTH